MTASTICTDKELAKLPVVRIQDVLIARLVAREEAGRLGFAPQALTQIATAVSEITRNVVQHSRGTGRVSILEVTKGSSIGLKIAVQDTGVGFNNIEQVLAGTSPGAGIPGCRKLMDEFAISSTAGTGTAVTMVKWLPRD